MAEPQVRYCTTTDAVSIAYTMIGDGGPVIDMGHPPITHQQLEWQLPAMRSWYERFGRHCRFIRFDPRGAGLSQRDISAFNAETLVCDLEAVASNVAGEFTLIGGMNSGAAAILYAARHPERVERLILWCAYARGQDFFDERGTRALREMLDKDWHMMTESASRSRFGWNQDAHARDIAALMRASVAPEIQAMLMDGLREVDVTPNLADVRAPTLVMQRQERGPDVARQIAAGIPDASLVIFDGVSAAPYLPDGDAVWNTIAEFLGFPTAAIEASDPRGARAGLQTILFTDIEANTELLQRVGDIAWRDILRDHERITRGLLAEHGGTEIKTIGDAFMTAFGSASAALDCAIALQQAFAAHNEQPGAAVPHVLRLRIGINAGEPIAEDDPDGRGDLFGTAVTTASRIQGLAKGGEILVSDVVRQLVAGKGFMFDDRGETVLRGFDDPVRIFAVRVG